MGLTDWTNKLTRKLSGLSASQQQGTGRVMRVEFDRDQGSPTNFFTLLRPMFRRYTEGQVRGIDGMLDYFEEIINTKPGDNDPRHMAYFFATTDWETGQRMEPVRETFATSDEEAMARLESAWVNGKLPWVKKPYWREGFFGRGRTQNTHKQNYEKQSRKHGIDLVANPNALLDSHTDMVVSYNACLDGDYRPPHSLRSYFNENTEDPVNAREIVNGDKNRQTQGSTVGQLIADDYFVYKDAIVKSLRQVDGVKPVPGPSPSPEDNLAVLNSHIDAIEKLGFGVWLYRRPSSKPPSE